MKRKKSVGESVFDVMNTIFMVAFIIVTLYPMWFVLVASISDGSLLLKHKGFLFHPLGLDFSTYTYVIKNPMILRGYANTLFIVIVGTTLNVLITAVAAYFLSKRNVLWKKPVMMMIVFSMFFSGGLIPLYLVIKGVGLYNSIWALIFPTLLSSYNIIVMRTYFMGLPAEIEESAVIDGANDMVILFKLIIPLSMPVVAVMILWYGVDHWNSWFHASIFITNRKLFPLQILLRQILINESLRELTSSMPSDATQNMNLTIRYTVIIVATLPILCVYPYLQKYFVKGMMIGSIKG